MSRLLSTVIGLLALAIALPTLAEAAQGAVPALVGLVVLLGLARLAWPVGRS